MENEIVQYYVVNHKLNMSPGKVASQVAHVAVQSALRYQNDPIFKEWYQNGISKIIVLRGKESQLRKLVDAGFEKINDLGFTEVPTGSLTAVALPPMYRTDAKKYIKGLQIYA